MTKQNKLNMYEIMFLLASAIFLIMLFMTLIFSPYDYRHRIVFAIVALGYMLILNNNLENQLKIKE